MNNSKRRYISMLTGILFLFITFASLFFIAKEETHECTGQDCPICACIHQAEHILNHLGSDMSAVVFMAVIPVFSTLLLFKLFMVAFDRSLVGEKVRLNN
ncbi:MAG TPA: hypothetical protein DCX57_07975 [Lachnospiraceae bacterium]|nr:hypothetical protein [Lachnospiraceae bacterium]